VKLFIDRDLGKKLGRSLTAIGIPATPHADRYTSPAERVSDQRWIREATAKGEVVLTRDGDIRRVDVEIKAIVESGARCFVLEVGNASAIDYLRAVMIAWPRIVEIVATNPPPYVYGINRRGHVRRRYPKKS
jgi:predicted nuclease of predicted toxin-antitoxin system